MERERDLDSLLDAGGGLRERLRERDRERERDTDDDLDLERRAERDLDVERERERVWERDLYTFRDHFYSPLLEKFL